MHICVYMHIYMYRYVNEHLFPCITLNLDTYAHVRYISELYDMYVNQCIDMYLYTCMCMYINLCMWVALAKGDLCPKIQI